MGSLSKKRGQVTIFLIVSILILITASLIFYTNSISFEKEQSITYFEFEPLRQYIERCIENTGKDGVLFVGLHGGYFNLPKYSTKDYLTKTAYYFYIDKDVMPSKNKIEEELSNYMNGEFFA